MNTHWATWIKSSIAKHFQLRSQGVTLWVEGERRARIEDNNRFELRVDGPDITKGPANWYKLETQINLLITSISNETDIYEMENLKGIILKAYTTTIPVYKYGHGGDHLGCLTLKSQVDVSDGGPRDDSVRQSYIAAMYNMELIYSFETYEASLTLATQTQIGAT